MRVVLVFAHGMKLESFIKIKWNKLMQKQLCLNLNLQGGHQDENRAIHKIPDGRSAAGNL
jgi:hypothetical protein